MSNVEIVYGKRKQDDGTWVEDKEFIARKFGEVLKACFICKKKHTCPAKTIEECNSKFELEDNVVVAKDF